MFRLVYGPLRLIGYTTAACILVAILQLFYLTQNPSRNNGTLRAQNPSNEQHPGKTQTIESPEHIKPANETLSDTWRKGLTVDDFNDLFERQLADCNAGSGSCSKNGAKLLLLDWNHFIWTIRGGLQGENIWCGIMMDALYKLGYSMLISTQKNTTYDWYRRYYKNTLFVIWDPDIAKECVYDPKCTYADVGSNLVPAPNATHINLPIWKIFHANWWNFPVHPLGGPFTLSPEPYDIWPAGQSGGKDNYYLGYTVEPTCLSTPFVPFAQRPRQAYIMGKYLGYFRDERYPLTDPVGGVPAQYKDDFYLNYSKEENVTFVAGQFSLFQAGNYTEPPPGITQHPRLERPEFQKMIANSRVMVGIGNPILSPTPYEALCLGIPFINPVAWWDRNDPNNRNYWEGQHGALIHGGLDEPYVYHVKVGDREGFKAALKKAMNTPIDRFILSRMSSKAVLDRMKTLVEADWRPVAERQIEAVGYRSTK